MPTHAKAKFYQPLVACIEDGVEHRFVKEEVAHPLGDDDVHLVHGELHLLDLALDERDDCCGVRECVSRHGGARKRKKKKTLVPSLKPLSATICLAWSMMDEQSICLCVCVGGV